MADRSEDDDLEELTNLRRAAVHEGGHTRMAQLKDAVVEWARAKRSGSGTTKVRDQDALPPFTRGLIAVAGCVAEEMTFGQRVELPPSDRELLRRALVDLRDPSQSEDTIRKHAQGLLQAQTREVERIAAILETRANAKVDGDALAELEPE
jgi:hypothetical protein